MCCCLARHTSAPKLFLVDRVVIGEQSDSPCVCRCQYFCGCKLSCWKTLSCSPPTPPLCWPLTLRLLLSLTPISPVSSVWRELSQGLQEPPGRGVSQEDEEHQSRVSTRSPVSLLQLPSTCQQPTQPTEHRWVESLESDTQQTTNCWKNLHTKANSYYNFQTIERTRI